jgi:hypothetical protein
VRWVTTEIEPQAVLSRGRRVRGAGWKCWPQARLQEEVFFFLRGGRDFKRKKKVVAFFSNVKGVLEKQNRFEPPSRSACSAPSPPRALTLTWREAPCSSDSSSSNSSNPKQEMARHKTRFSAEVSVLRLWREKHPEYLREFWPPSADARTWKGVAFRGGAARGTAAGTTTTTSRTTAGLVGLYNLVTRVFRKRAPGPNPRACTIT